jgi:bacterioferritin-associated ferredoxin
MIDSLLRHVRGEASGVLSARTTDQTQAAFVCHCERVSYGTVEKAIRRGAKSMADVQRRTSACTRCFGCRFELERMLRNAYGDAYHHEKTITLPARRRGTRTPRPMYMPVLAGFRGHDIDTRVIVFNWDGSDRSAAFRADLLKLDGERIRAVEHTVPAGCSAVLDYGRDSVAGGLPDGLGVVKLVLETEEVGSLRPYFQFVTPSCIASTHEKKGPVRPERLESRRYHWIFPIGPGRRSDECYLFFTNTQMAAMESQQLVWQSHDGRIERAELPPLEFGQSACIPLHERFRSLNDGVGGTVRIEPAQHVVAGFMLRHEPEDELWRVQHL